MFDTVSVLKMRCLNNILEDFFYSYATFLIRYVYIFLFGPVFLTVILSSGLYFINRQNWNDTEYVFAPANGLSIFERKTFDQQFPLMQDKFVPGQSFEVKHYFYVIITGKGNFKNLLNESSLNEIEKLNNFILDHLTVDSYDGLYKINYRRICLTDQSVCFENKHIPLLINRELLEDVGEKVTYPILRLSDGTTVNLAGIFGSVVTNEDGTLTEIGAVRLVYFMKHSPPEYHFYSIQFRDRLARYLLNEYKSGVIEVTFGNEQSLTEGVQENTTRYIPAIGVTVALVLTFSYLCSFIFYQSREGSCCKPKPVVDWVRSKPLLAFIGTVEPGLAVVSTVGLLLWFGCPYNDIIIVMPFLVFGN